MTPKEVDDMIRDETDDLVGSMQDGVLSPSVTSEQGARPVDRPCRGLMSEAIVEYPGFPEEGSRNDGDRTGHEAGGGFLHGCLWRTVR